ncbi:MAG: hypothetical protein QXJ56_06390 [Ignisphaera sp.]|uniref:Uncharacterized protein n=1 Tax=Ignisphaera aggregans TaxID=334771 RepID=A0A7J3JSE1_9CREN
MVRRETALEKLLNILPGFHGYRRKEYIREDDRLVREYIVGILSGAIRDLEEAIANLAEYDFKAAELYDSVLRDLRAVADRIRWAEHGYAPHFNIIKIQEEDLGRIREVDAGLVDDVEKIRDFVMNIKRETLLRNPVRDRVPDLLKLLDDLRSRLLEREKIIRGWT